MKCSHSHCSCGTIDGGYCSEACADAIYRSSRDENCGCGHAGCSTVP